MNSNKAAISLTTGLEDAEKVTVAFLVAVGAAESGRPTLGGRYLVCPICIKSKQLDADGFIDGAEPGGTVQLWEWIGDGATTFSY